jgi:hypothetical protein
MPTGTINKTYSSPGTNSRTARVTRTTDNSQIWGGNDSPITLNAAAVMDTYAEGSANEVTGNAVGHGYGNGEHSCDFYWQESGVNKVRYGVPTTFSSDALVTTSAGAGDDFPTTPDAEPVLCKQLEVAAAIDGDEVALFWAIFVFANVAATGRGHIDYQEDNDTSVGAINVSGILQGTAVADYDIEGGAANPLTGNPIFHMQISHNDTVFTPTFEQSVFADSTA